MDEIFSLRGGLDQETIQLEVPPGTCFGAKNFEPGLSGGYRRMNGYEKFDGQPKPHLQTYTAFTVSDASTISEGDTVTGVTSGATGICIGSDTDSDTVGVTKVSGTFVDGESVTVTTIASVLGVDLGPDALHETWLLNAHDEYRDDIQAVPGSGDVLGVVKHDGVEYAFRNNAGGTECDMHKATAAGWVQVTFDNILLFDAGSGDEIEVGDTVTGPTSGASASVLAVVTYAGIWNSDAEGYLVLDTITGGPFQDGENLQVSAVTRAVANGASYAYTMSPGGAFEFMSKNFYATSGGYNLYGCDGVNAAFEFDGTTLVPVLLPGIAGAPATNAPTLITEHKGHLFLMFSDGLVQHSVQGYPTTFIGFLGAGEFGLGSAGTAMFSEVGGPLLLRTLRETYGIFGTDVDTWELKKISGFGGSVMFTSQYMGDLVSLDTKGVVLQSRTEKFGDFESATVSRKVQSFVNALVPIATRSVVVRGKNQYRVYGSDNTFLVMYLDTDGETQFMRGEYLTDVTCIDNNPDNESDEIYFGSSDGYVYQADVGKNFDGAAIEAFLQLNFNHAKYPSVRKHYRRAFLELDAEGSVTLRLSAQVGYGSRNTLEPEPVTSSPEFEVAFGGGGFWDISQWGSFYYDAEILSNLRFEMLGNGINFAVVVYNSSALVDPFTIQSVRADFDLRRKQR